MCFIGDCLRSAMYLNALAKMSSKRCCLNYFEVISWIMLFCLFSEEIYSEIRRQSFGFMSLISGMLFLN